jgi:hypothetical protein
MLALKNMFETLQTTEEDKEDVKVMNELCMMIARLELVARATGFQTKAQGNTLQSAQIDIQMQQLMQQMNQMFGNMQEIQPVGHNEPTSSTEIQYPKENSGQMDVSGSESAINPPSIEAVSGAAQKPPAMTGALT